MKLIAITGLAGLEKGRLTLDLARHLHERGASVAVLDHGQALNSHAEGWTFERINGDLSAQLPAALEHAQTHDYAILNVSESVSPEQLYADLDMSVAQVPTMSMDEVRVLAILDDRTCSCFPHVEALLEEYADVTLRYPFTLEEALAVL